MSSINWDDAPEGATHFSPETITEVACWIKQECDLSSYIATGYHKRKSKNEPDHWLPTEDFNIKELTPRPSKQVKPDDKPVFTQAMADNGELPSVGMECLVYDLSSDTFHKCELIMIHKKSFVWDSDGWDGAFVTSDSVKLKPIPTKPDLIDGAAYQFWFKNLKRLAFYDLMGNEFTNGLHTWNAVDCENITPLTPKDK